MKIGVLILLINFVIPNDISVYFCLMLASKNPEYMKNLVTELIPNREREKIQKMYFLIFNNCSEKLKDLNEKEIF